MVAVMSRIRPNYHERAGFSWRELIRRLVLRGDRAQARIAALGHQK